MNNFSSLRYFPGEETPASGWMATCGDHAMLKMLPLGAGAWKPWKILAFLKQGYPHKVVPPQL